MFIYYFHSIPNLENKSEVFHKNKRQEESSTPSDQNFKSSIIFTGSSFFTFTNDRCFYFVHKYDTKFQIVHWMIKENRNFIYPVIEVNVFSYKSLGFLSTNPKESMSFFFLLNFSPED